MLTLNDGRDELWQWDTGRTLDVDEDCTQVHFSNNVFGRSIDVDVVGGVAIIPDILLQTDKDLNVWAFSGTAENGYTKISKTFKVNRRNKPADYVFTPTDQTSLEEIKEKIDYLESMQDPDAIKNAVDDYLEQNPVEIQVQSVNGQTGAVELDADDVGAIAATELQTAINTALAQAKASGEFDGAQGPAGSDATVTAENIQSALGYTPADSADLADKLTAPSTAAAGQIFQIKSINEDGSLVLEAVDMPSGESDKPFELIDTITLDENVAQIVRNTEPDGTPYNFCKMMVSVKIPGSTPFTAGFASELIADTFYFYGPFSESTQYICQVILLLEIRNGRVFGNMAESVGSGHTASSYRGTVNLSGNLIKDAIDVFRMKTYASSGIPSGVEVSIYGVRK